MSGEITLTWTTECDERLSRRIFARHLARELGNVHPRGIDADLAKNSGHDRLGLCQHIGRHLRIVVDDDAHWQPLVLGPGRLGWPQPERGRHRPREDRSFADRHVRGLLKPSRDGFVS